jgi:hypothetical protein
MLSEAKIKEIEKASGISGLLEMINSKDEVNVELKNKFHFTQETYDALYSNLTEKNLTPEKGEELKKAGEEIAVKAIKRARGYEFDGKSAEQLANFLEGRIQNSKTEDIEKLNKAHEQELSDLRKIVEKERKEKEDLVLKSENDKINSVISRLVDGLEIDVPANIKEDTEKEKYIKIERQKSELHFRSLYQFKSENDNVIGIKDGEIIKDELKNPLTVDKLFEKYKQDSFVSLKKQQGGRGDGDYVPKANLSHIKSLPDLESYAKSKGIKKGSEEYDALYEEFNKNKK